MIEMTEEQRRVRRITIEALDMSRVSDPDDDLEKILDRVVRRYGEDAIREFIRMIVIRGMTPEEAGTFIAGDGAVGQQLAIVVNHVSHRVE